MPLAREQGRLLRPSRRTGSRGPGVQGLDVYRHRIPRLPGAAVDEELPARRRPASTRQGAGSRRRLDRVLRVSDPVQASAPATLSSPGSKGMLPGHARCRPGWSAAARERWLASRRPSGAPAGRAPGRGRDRHPQALIDRRGLGPGTRDRRQWRCRLAVGAAHGLPFLLQSRGT